MHNFKRQENRRVEFTINVTNQTPIDKLRKIPALIQGIIRQMADTRFDRAHFAKFSEYGLSIVVVYFITVPDYLRYMDNQQEINLKIMEAFETENIDFQVREDKFLAIDQGAHELQPNETQPVAPNK
ncbi:MAG: hypothetical protein WKF87_06285 [Chryseolinea sp.]